MESIDAVMAHEVLSPNQWRVHGSCVAHHGRATLFIGPAASGKSRLAAEAILLGGAELVADDQVVLTLREGIIYAAAVANIEGVLALREQGLMKLNALRDVPLTSVISTVPCSNNGGHITLLGTKMPLICLSNAQVAQSVVEALFSRASAAGQILPEDWMPQKAA